MCQSCRNELHGPQWSKSYTFRLWSPKIVDHPNCVPVIYLTAHTIPYWNSYMSLISFYHFKGLNYTIWVNICIHMFNLYCLLFTLFCVTQYYILNTMYSSLLLLGVNLLTLHVTYKLHTYTQRNTHMFSTAYHTNQQQVVSGNLWYTDNSPLLGCVNNESGNPAERVEPLCTTHCVNTPGSTRRAPENPHHKTHPPQ